MAHRHGGVHEVGRVPVPLTPVPLTLGEYIEDILTRILMGEEVDASFLPCDYVRHFEDGKDAEVTKVSQAVA